MVNLSKLIAIFLLGLFVTVGCAENKGSSDSISDGSSGNKDLVFKQIYPINGFVYGETVDGKKYIWGNVGEMLSEGNTDNITTPKEVTFTVKSTYQFYDSVYKIAYVLTDTGLYGWGNDRVQVGNGTTTNVLNPIRIDEQNGKKIIEGNIKEVISKDETVYVITDTGLYAWGDNTGNGTTENVLSPVRIDVQNGQKIIEGNIQEVIVDGSNVYVRTDIGLYAWGPNYGGVGNGTVENVLSPVRIDEQNGKKIIEGNIQEVIVDASTVYVRTDTGLYAWGSNYRGQLGNGTTENELTPIRIDEQNGKKIIEGNIQEVIVDASTVYVRTDTGLYAWGSNYRGQLGNGTTENELTPIRIDEQNGKKIIEGNIQEVILYINTVYVITDIGIYAWSNNDFGQVGNGTIHSHYYVLSPARIDEQNGKKLIEGKIQEVIVDGSTVCVRTDKGLYGWGPNSRGQLGNGTTESELSPVRIDEQNGKKLIEGKIQEVIVDGSTVYVRTDSGLYSWGKNDYGQVGNGDSGFEKDENGNITSKPKYVLTPYKI